MALAKKTLIKQNYFENMAVDHALGAGKDFVEHGRAIDVDKLL